MSEFHGGPAPQQQPGPFQQPPVKKSHTLRTVLIVVASVFAVLIVGVVSCTAMVGSALDEATDSPTGAASTTPAAAPSSAPSVDHATACQKVLVAGGIKLFSERPAACQPLDEAEFSRVSEAAMTEIMNQYTPTPTEEPAQDTTTIGKTLTYESGLAVRVVSAKVFNPGSYASGLVTGQKAVKVTWTITNGTEANVDLSGAEARLTYGADGVQAESVYADGVDGQYPFDGSVRPGQKKTATSAFSVPKAGLSSIVVEVEPEYESQTAFFTGSAK